MSKEIAVTTANLKKIGKTLRSIREDENVSQTALAKKMKKEQSFVSNAENAVKIPSLPTILNYVGKLGYAVVFKKIK